MALIGLYSLASLLFFINIEPFKAIGVLLSICYLPGLALFALAKRDKLFFEDLLLAFPCSIGISSILTLLLLFTGVHIVYIAIIIHIIVGATVVLYIIAGYRQKTYVIVEINKQQLTFCLFAFFIILLFSIPFFFGLNRMGIAAHAFHHSLLITQILNGIFPPENPGLGGSNIGYYWGFHCLIAAITAQTNFHQLQIVFIINMLSLYLIFCIAYSFAKAYKLSEIYCYIFPVAVISLMRFDAGILFLVKLFSGNLASLKEISSPVVEPYDFELQWLMGIPWFDPRLFFLTKFYNVSGMPLAIGVCFSYLLILRLSLKAEVIENKVYLISIGLLLTACFFNYPPLAIFLLLQAPMWICVIFLSNKGNVYDKTREALKIAVPYILAGLIVAPYMVFIMMSRDTSSSGQGRIFNFDFYDQSIRNIVVFLIPFPLIIYGIWSAFKRLSFSRELLFLLSGTVLCLVLSVFTRWPFDNSYKFNYVLTFFFAFFFVLALSDWLQLLSRKWLKLLIATCIITVFTLNPLIIEASYLVSYLFTDYKYTFSGRHLLWARDELKNEAYTWIRNNTPGNALLVLSYTETNWPCCGINNNYETAAMTERTLYVIKDKDYTVSNPDYAKRILFREKLFENPEDRSVIAFFSELNRPVYLLIEDNLPENKFFVENRFKQFPENPGWPFVLKFHNDKHRVYFIDFDK